MSSTHTIVWSLRNFFQFEVTWIWPKGSSSWEYCHTILTTYWFISQITSQFQIHAKNYIHVYMSRPLKNCKNFNFAPLYKSFWCISKNYNYFNLNFWKIEFWEVTISILVKWGLRIFPDLILLRRRFMSL